MSIILHIPDTHSPFMHPKAIGFLKTLKKDFKPDVIVHAGDEADFHGISDWPTDPDGMSSGDELKATVEQLKELYALFPNVKVCKSNHTARPFRKAYKVGLPAAFIRSYREFLQAPKGWEWADQWVIDGVLFIHGEGFTGRKAALEAALANRMNTVIGHVHSNAGLCYLNNGHSQIWGLNGGCLVDTKAYAFAYGKTHKDKPVLGASLIIDGVPTFIPLF